MADVAVTGANGFVGRAVCAALLERGHAVRALVRSARGRADLVDDERVQVIVVGDLEGSADLVEPLRGVDAVIHLAARVHQMDEGDDAIDAYRRANVDATARVVDAAADVDARVVFASTIKVNGEVPPARGFTEDDVPHPVGPYAVTKREAEDALRARDDVEWVIVRPTLVYGPGAKGNLEKLMRALARGVPLPLGRAKARRAMIGVHNLADLFVECALHPAAPGETFLATDDPVAVRELVAHLKRSLNVRTPVVPVPARLMRAAGRAANKDEVMRRLFADFLVDGGKARRVLGWRSPRSTQAELDEMARAFVAAQRSAA